MFDGEGIGDDRRINLLQRVVASWVSSKNTSELENLVMLNKCLSIIRAIECSWIKSDLMKKCIEKETELFKNFQNGTKKNIENIKETIDASKIILLEAREEKQHKLNYNMIAEDIATVPSRIETLDMVNEQNENILQLESEISKCNANWVRWRQHFRVIATSANELWQSLRELTEN